jgi:hypothetical protein
MSEPKSPRQVVEALMRDISDAEWDELDGSCQPCVASYSALNVADLTEVEFTSRTSLVRA